MRSANCGHTKGGRQQKRVSEPDKPQGSQKSAGSGALLAMPNLISRVQGVSIDID